MDIKFQLRECNWLQAVEGEIDTSHLGFLHYGSVSVGTPSRDINNYSVVNRAPEYAAKDTEYGMIYGAHRPGRKEDELYWRMAHFMFPCWTMPPLDTLQANVSARGYIPLDDENTMIVAYDHKRGESRSPWKKGQSIELRQAEGHGDCVNCRQCVAVCPTAAIEYAEAETADWLGTFADERADPMAASDEHARQVAAGEAGCAGDEVSHVRRRR